jgi:hypothetical protein
MPIFVGERHAHVCPLSNGIINVVVMYKTQQARGKQKLAKLVFSEEIVKEPRILCTDHLMIDHDHHGQG